MYFHGYASSSDTGNVKTIVRAYIQNDGFNILILDWRQLAAEFYLKAISGIQEVCNIDFRHHLLFHVLFFEKVGYGNR